MIFYLVRFINIYKIISIAVSVIVRSRSAAYVFRYHVAASTWLPVSPVICNSQGCKSVSFIICFLGHVMWVLVTTAWRVLRLRMKETAFIYGGLPVYGISSRGQPTSDDPPSWGLSDGLITPQRKKKISCYEMLRRYLELAGSWEHGNEPSESRGISWVAEWLLASQEGPCCMELFILKICTEKIDVTFHALKR
jgi:hypothetical protein